MRFLDRITLTEQTAPATPAAGLVELYPASSDKKAHTLDSTATDTALGAGGSTGIGSLMAMGL